MTPSSFVDAKFYLFSAKSRGRPARPKAVYARSALLAESSEYLKNLLSSETGFSGGTTCNLRGSASEEIAKLDPDSFDYDSDSDLEDDDEDGSDYLITESTGKGKAEETPGGTSSGGLAPATAFGVSSSQDGTAYAINGTAYKTWRAFIFHTYTGEIDFSQLRSQRLDALLEPASPGQAACSPKSMYRFADYADIPALKSLAKEGIKTSLSTSNIITELFSSFTHKYQEIIELEVEFLVENFTSSVSRDFNEMLKMIVLGTKPHCFRVLAFAFRRLLGDNTEKAWALLDKGAGGFEEAMTPIGLDRPVYRASSSQSSESGREVLFD
ncbi:hypothetical protein NP233_g2260 [Leucocoprinus birnbaumii]|uniref:BTB domain-containing protein n=1 Tax=Leucocoprinus birnbaumii TaxID=56174 RepID=A0AAD5VYP7_9AGAR|nr:hypothetical protein NP233_g2260 [Leucocoprinus birnbaumii]